LKIKYKLIIILTLLVLASTLPLSLFNLQVQKRDKTDALVRSGSLNAGMLSGLAMNIIMMNGGDIKSSSVDLNEMLKGYAALEAEGLIYVEIILLSQNETYNGTLLAYHKTSDEYEHSPVIETGIQSVKNHPGHTQTLYNDNSIYHEFVSVEDYNSKPVCAVRAVYSDRVLNRSIDAMKLKVYLSALIAVATVCAIGLFFSRMITKPIDMLVEDISQAESGNFDYDVTINSRDEIGRLARTFNHFSRMLKLQITELMSANRELRRLDLLKDEFLANMTHELRSPLHGMLGIAESLIEGAAGPLPDDAIHDLNLMLSSGSRLLNLVNDILDFSKLKHKDIELSFEDVDISTIVQHSILITAPLIRRKNVVMKNEIDPAACIAFGDPERLRQIIINLIANAIKFTTEGEIVISSVYSQYAGMIEISVIDTGIGILPERIDRIFETFEQADGSTSRTYGGTGLGLAITKRLVELHGGSIYVDSEPGKGSRFYFTVKSSSAVNPVAVDVTLPVEVTAFQSEDSGSIEIRGRKESGIKYNYKGRILAVDDEPVNLQLLINHLSLDHYEVITAENGYEALEYINSGTPPDLVLLDVMLPKISGIEVCRLIREKFTAQDVPVMMLTAKNRTEDVVAGLDAGANDYLIKPVNRRELLARVNSLISLKKSVLSRDELNLLKRDIHIAHEIQNSILTQDVPKDSRYSISANYRPMYELGGDFYEIIKIDDERTGVLIADVSGHGIPAAIICAMLKVIFGFHSDLLNSPGAMLERINRTISPYLGNQFITACYACIDLAGMTVKESSAGHWPMLIHRRGTGIVEHREGKGVPIGWLDDAKYDEELYKLSTGDRLIFFTDFIVEARNPEEKMYGLNNFKELIKESAAMFSGEFTDTTMSVLIEWCGAKSQAQFEDDATLIAVDIL
jgi:two-component system sensor histidine kinase ChiS